MILRATSRREPLHASGRARPSAISAGIAVIWALLRMREFSNTFWLVVGDGSGKLVLFAANIYLARTLRPGAFGLFVVAQSLTYYAWNATDLGTTMHGIREIARNRGDTQDIVSSLLGLRLAAGVAGLAIALTLIWVWPLPLASRLVFSGTSVYLVSRAVYPDFALKGVERFRALALGGIPGGLAFLGASLAVIHGPSQAPEAAFIWSCTWFLGAAILAAYLRTQRKISVKPTFHLRTWWRHLRPSSHFALTGGITMVYDTLPILLAAAVYGSAQSGIFSAAYKLMINLTSVIYFIPSALYPVLSERYASDFAAFMHTHRQLRTVMVIGGLLACAGGIVFAQPIVWLLLGKDYSEATAVFRVLSLDLVCYALRFTYGTALGASGNQKYYAVVSMIGIVVLGAAFLPATRFGLPGEALCVVLADASVALALMVVLRRKLALDPRASRRGSPSGAAT